MLNTIDVRTKLIPLREKELKSDGKGRVRREAGTLPRAAIDSASEATGLAREVEAEVEGEEMQERVTRHLADG